MDMLEYDIKQFLLTSPNMKAQWKKIRDGVYPNHKKDYSTLSSFGVTLDRTLKRLIELDDIGKEVSGHRSVFYFIKKNRREAINKQLLKTDIGKSFGDFWDAKTPEQRKGIVQSLTNHGILTNWVTQQFIGNIAKEFTELVSIYKSELEKPSVSTEQKFSIEQREEFLKELEIASSELKKIIAQNEPPKNQDIRTEINRRLELAQEFQKVVVDSLYEGKWDLAIFSLMRNAIEEQKGKKRK
jgi:hypothetical protein